MTRQLKIRITVDIFITIALILQMGYMIVGDLAHEISGTITVVLWVVHNLLHRKWYSSVGKGKYPPRRIIDTVINLLLLLSVLGITVSAVILSSYVFSFLGIETGMGFARSLHMVSVYWCFILSSLHLGLHWSRMMKIIRKHTGLEASKVRTVVLNIIAASVSVFGLYAFIKQNLYSYMFLRTMFVFFDFEQPVFAFFLEYVCIMVLFASVTYYISAALNKLRLRRSRVCSADPQN